MNTKRNEDSQALIRRLNICSAGKQIEDILYSVGADVNKERATRCLGTGTQPQVVRFGIDKHVRMDNNK